MPHYFSTSTFNKCIVIEQLPDIKWAVKNLSVMFASFLALDNFAPCSLQLPGTSVFQIECLSDKIVIQRRIGKLLNTTLKRSFLKVNNKMISRRNNSYAVYWKNCWKARIRLEPFSQSFMSWNEKI